MRLGIYSKNRFGQATSADVDWEACGQAMASSSLTTRHWIVKHTSGMCGTGKMMKLWKQRSSSKCPRCEAPVEDAAHVWRCPQPEAKAVWEQSIDGLREWMTKQKTHPAIKRIICERLLAWHSGIPSQAQPDGIPFLRSAVNAQDALGWQSFLEGGLAFDWQFAQQHYFKSLKSMKSGRRWVSALIRKLWTVAWDQWQHRNGILHDRDSTQQHKLLSHDTDRLISRQFAMGVQGLPSNNHFLFQEPMEELLKAPLYVRKQWLALAQSARERQKRRVAAQAEKYPEERQSMANWLLRGTG
jgi:hypothetical protein